MTPCLNWNQGQCVTYLLIEWDQCAMEVLAAGAAAAIIAHASNLLVGAREANVGVLHCLYGLTVVIVFNVDGALGATISSNPRNTAHSHNGRQGEELERTHDVCCSLGHVLRLEVGASCDVDASGNQKIGGGGLDCARARNTSSQAKEVGGMQLSKDAARKVD